MYEDYLNYTCKIIKKNPNNIGGLSKNNETIINNIKCRLTSPNQKDLKLIDHIKNVNKQIQKIYFGKDTTIGDKDCIEINSVRYEIIYLYKVSGMKDNHHIKGLITTIN